MILYAVCVMQNVHYCTILYITLPDFGADFEWYESWVVCPRQVDVDIIRLGEEDNACSVCYETQDVSALAGVTWK